MDFGQFQRYKTVQILIDKIIKYYNTQTLSILEIGANEQENLEKLVTDAEITYSDLSFPDTVKNDGKHIIADATDLKNIKDVQYDIVIALDVFEHIPLVKREAFLKEITRVARLGTIICFPFDSKTIENAEYGANEYYKNIFQKDHIWLSQHSYNILPSIEKTKVIINKLKQKYFIFEHGDISIWEEMMKTLFGSYHYMELVSFNKKMEEFYEETIFYNDIGVNNYRSFIIINRNEDLNKYLHKEVDSVFLKPANDKFSKMLSNTIQTFRELSTNQTISNKFKFYLDYGDGFSEENCLYVESLINKADGRFHLYTDLSNDIKNIRLDPAENSCIISDVKVTTNRGEIDSFYNNGLVLGDFLIFNNNDPQFHYNLSKGTKYIRVKGKITILDSSHLCGLFSYLSNLYNKK
jgi:hypothetical protein